MKLPRVTKTVRAEQDLDEIWFYIAADNPAADVLLETIGVRCRLLATQPLGGRLRHDLGVDLRSLVVSHYVIFYRPAPAGVEIVRVLHGSRDIEGILRDEEHS